MERARVMAGELRSRLGSPMTCCVARAEPEGGEEKRKERNEQATIVKKKATDNIDTPPVQLALSVRSIKCINQ